MTQTETQDWRTMRAGRALDALVAERVMGWERVAAIGTPLWRAPGDGPARFGGPNSHPYYSTDIAAAWSIVEKLAAPHLYLTSGNGNDSRWRCAFAPTGTAQSAPTAPLAICRAALAATEPAS